jgi:hypothetical protein
MTYDYSDAPEQRGDELIPAGTIATVQMTIRPGGASEGGLFTRSKDGQCEMLDLEFVVVDGPHIKRKFWERMVLAGTSDGHAKAVEISRGKLRAILESARGIKPEDMSPEARKARTAELGDFQGICFIAKIGREKGKPKNDGSGESFSDRNILAMVITPDRKDWRAAEQMPRPTSPTNGGAAAVAAVTAPAPIVKPAWAAS